MKGQYKRLVNMAATVLLLAVQAAIFSYFWYKYFNVGSSGFIQFRGKGNIAAIGIYMIFIIFFTSALDGYKMSYLKISEMCISHTIAIICANVVEYAELCIIRYSWAPVWTMLIMTAIELAVSYVWIYVIRRIYLAVYPPHNMIFIYGDRVQTELINKINARGDKYDIKESISISCGLDNIYERISGFESVIIGDIPAQLRNDLVKYCFANNIRAYITPKISDLIVGGSEEINLFDTPLLLSRNFGLSAEQLFLKRIMDILISLVLLILLSPFMLITAICIKCYDGGPVFYRQERFTRDRKIFKILKFRSMKIDSEADGARVTCKDDDRITPVGKVIRRIHFDEIPQLINILKGDMSLVGPRPEWKFTVEKYEKEIPEFAFRLKVKAGLTGYAQVYGKYNTTPYDKLKLDLTYIEKYSVILDIKIILMTVKAVLSKDNSEGVEKDQRTALKNE